MTDVGPGSSPSIHDSTCILARAGGNTSPATEIGTATVMSSISAATAVWLSVLGSDIPFGQLFCDAEWFVG